MRMTIAAASMLFLANAHAARCELDGVAVNLDNGSTTDGRTGVVKCYAPDGSLVHEQELRDGRFIGLDRRYENGRVSSERQVNANGNSDGLAREWYPNGQLKRESHEQNGSSIGLSRGWFEDGKPSALGVVEKPGAPAALTIEYNAQGQLKELRCATRSLLPEDKTPCGFEGHDAKTELHDARGRLRAELTIRAGKVLASREYGVEGKLASGFELTSDGRVERRYHDNGQVGVERVVASDYVVRETEWYMSGRMKSKTQREPVERRAKSTVERWRDSGALASRTELIGERRVHEQTYDERGAPAEEFFYDDEGVLARHRAFGPDGAIKVDEELFPDGSRKSSLAAPKD